METLKIIEEKKRVAATSVLAAVLITGLKLVVGLETNSLGILSEAAHSGLDLMAAIMTMFAVSISDRPPDPEHQYGHGKIENVSAFLETLLLFFTCGWIIYEAVHRLITGVVHLEVTVWSFAVMAVSIIVDLGRSRALKRIAVKYNSLALEADALHFSSDVWTSIVVIVGLIFVSIGLSWFDPIVAIAVALLVLFVSFRLARRTIDALMDRVPEGMSEKITEAMKKVQGVEEIRSLRLRASGSKLFVDTTVAVPRTVPFQQVHIVTDNIEHAVRMIREDADVVVHAEPFETSDETIADKVRMIVLGKGLLVPHNLEVHQTQGRYHIDFDVEYRKGMTFVEAHELTTEIERDIKKAIPRLENVTIHMEESQPEEPAIDSATAHQTRLRDDIHAEVRRDPRIVGCHGVNLLRVDNKYNLTLTCTFDKEKTLGEVHDIICGLETKLYEKFRAVRRITIHAEPANESIGKEKQ